MAGAALRGTVGWAKPSDDRLGGAKPGEGGLEEVQSDEGGEEKECRVDEVGEGEGGEDEGAGEGADDVLGVHGGVGRRWM